ncbi:PDR/VanB family oxidoreductase [Variovorax sp. PBL-E5]|uniref:PDR/VanB family oxidoreductase n=1 Tax=Variovorax sp. PBL-E5 TaxID=434014 RepID=UPI001316FE06|nr:PDR/VanB family oxidoreductase [Variovorax sp. PBL-E5]VTU35991.1 Phenoxybenzoate dioxygenase subunit beta [Variovorax sp. PBL-E5]
MNSSSLLHVTVSAVRREARHIVSLELRPRTREALPVFEPGAHIDLHLAPDLVRSYSLLNPDTEGDRYRIAILNDRNSRGGSRHVHERLAVGSMLDISPPRNHFPLNTEASRSVLLAGGIGITPILAMHERLAALGKPASLLYCARSRPEAAFCERLGSSKSVSFHFDEEQGRPPDLREFLSGEPAASDFYCCGPAPMIAAFERICEELGFRKVHVERFAADAGHGVSRQQHPYTVTLARTGRTLAVQPGVALLDALHQAGIDADCGCREGVCRACETRVLEGIPAHRDSVLSSEERASNRTMMVCVSGCVGEHLVLDL